MADTPAPKGVTAAVLAGCFVAFLGFGFSSTFGVFLAPMAADLGWGREVFSLSFAVQMLTWGFAQPIAGAIADRTGTARVLAGGAILAGLGFAARGVFEDPTLFVLSGLLVGAGTGAASFPIVMGALSKLVPPERRSFVLGLGTASASLGMFAAAPSATALIAQTDWQPALLILGACFALIPLVVWAIARVDRPTAAGAGAQDFRLAITTAFTDRSYLCLFFGFYVCGFHVAFMQMHLPAYITDQGLSAQIGAWSIALVGLVNIAGSFGAGWLGQIFSQKRVLAGIYLARALVITVFILVPISAASVLVFSAVMGLLWLSTVPLTMGLVALTQGMRFLSTLAGLVFLSHQTGSFTGAWLGGRLYDLNQDYTPMWWAAVALGLLAALIHLPIRETPGPLAQAERA